MYSARIELANKVLDSYQKLRRTLCHEMCHVAAWLLDHNAKPPHGPVFKKWAQRAMSRYTDLEVSTCHNYDIHFAYKWRCTWCTHEYGRHSKSIDPTKHRCGKDGCKGPLEYLGKFNPDGSLTTARNPSAYNQFIKENMSTVKKEMPAGTPSKDLMKILSERYRATKGGGTGGKEEEEDESSQVDSTMRKLNLA